MGWVVQSFDDVGIFDKRKTWYEPDADIFDVAISVSESSPVAYDQFHIYESEDE